MLRYVKMASLQKPFLNLLNRNLTISKNSILSDIKCIIVAHKLLPRTYACKKNTKAKTKQKLLKFPAIKLEETMPKFLKSVEPLLTCEELKETECIVEDFMKGEGAALQKLLEEVAKKEVNWLAPRWLKLAYLGYRDPVTVYSSPGMTFPIKKFKNKDDYLMYTAKVIMGLIKFKKLVDEGKMPIVKLGKNELDNSQFGAVFGTCRIPLPEVDGLEYYPESKHVTIIHKNNFYKLSVYNKCGEILNAEVLAQQLKCICECEKNFGPPLGLLSTDTRDNWAKAYKKIVDNCSNYKKVKLIQKSLFTVSLDQEVCFDEENKYVVLGQQLIHGGGAKENSANRWMDKTIQVIVNPNGLSGFCYEHSPAEGQPIAMMADYVSSILNKDSEFTDGACDNYKSFTKIDLTVPESGLKKEMELAKQNINDLASDLHLYVNHFKTYGKEFLKTVKLSPDSFIQVALQYAFYKLHNYPTAQYESAHLRVYYGGRTETIRSCSTDSVAFAKAMLCQNDSDKALVGLLREAVNNHRKYTSMALLGKGVDRHLAGLKLMAIENKKPIPKFFSSKAYVKSSHYRISTSQVATPNKAFMCYGAPVKDGYGCCYNPRKNDIFLACSCWHSNKETNAKNYADCITEALNEMQKVLEKERKQNPK